MAFPIWATISVFLGSLVVAQNVATSTGYIARETPTIREYFYAGGSYVDDATTGGQILSGQMYVERLTPLGGAKRKYPLVFIHGAGQTGTNWLNKPDGSPGWASYFVSRGYDIYLIDQTLRARSAYHGTEGNLTYSSIQTIQQRFTAPERYNLWPEAGLHTQWPGSGVAGDAYFDAFYASNVAYVSSPVLQQSSIQAAGAALLDRIGKPVILIGHSQGGPVLWLFGDIRSNLTKAIYAIEPSGPPFFEGVFTNTASRKYGLTDSRLTYAPPVTNPGVDLARAVIPPRKPEYISNCTIQALSPPPRQLVNLAKIPTRVMTTTASYHVPYDWCTVEYLKQAGVNATHLSLADAGIHGNGHMVFLEKNSDEVAGVVLEWIEGIY